MKTGHPMLRSALAGLIGLGLLTLSTAFKAGDTAYSKRIDTPLLADPKPLAATAGKVGFAAALKVREVRGAWLHVQAKDGSGWVFEGNVSDDKPTLTPTAKLTAVTADSTDTTAAARPLTEAAEGYATRHAEAKDKADVEWIDATSAGIPDDEIVVFMRDNKKGEYRE